jgi:hypothetical protein
MVGADADIVHRKGSAISMNEMSPSLNSKSLAGSDAQVPLKVLLDDRHVIGAAGLSPSAQFCIRERSDDDIYAARLITVCHSSPSPGLPVCDRTVDMLVNMHIFDAQT